MARNQLDAVDYYAKVWRILRVLWLKWPEEQAQRHVQHLIDEYGRSPLFEHETPAWYVVDVVMERFSPDHAIHFAPDLWGGLAVRITEFVEPIHEATDSYEWSQLDAAAIRYIERWLSEH